MKIMIPLSFIVIRFHAFSNRRQFELSQLILSAKWLCFARWCIVQSLILRHSSSAKGCGMRVSDVPRSLKSMPMYLTTLTVKWFASCEIGSSSRRRSPKVGVTQKMDFLKTSLGQEIQITLHGQATTDSATKYVAHNT